MGKERLTLWVTPEAKAAVKQRADEAGVSMSAWVSVMASNGLEAIADYVDKRAGRKLHEAFERQAIEEFGAEEWARMKAEWAREDAENAKDREDA